MTTALVVEVWVWAKKSRMHKKLFPGSRQGEEAGAWLALPHRLPPLLQRGRAARSAEPEQAEEAEQGEKILVLSVTLCFCKPQTSDLKVFKAVSHACYDF